VIHEELMNTQKSLRRKQIAVIGSASPSREGYHAALEAGRFLGTRDVIVLCGGMGGVMEAVSQGVQETGGMVVGIVPGERSDANSWLDAVIAPGMGLSRNYILVRSADAVLAIEGGIGTLSELSFAVQLEIPIVGYRTWDIPEISLLQSDSISEAVQTVLECAGA